MSFFDDDPFESIVKEFFGNSSARRKQQREDFIQGEDEDRVIDFVQDKEKLYLVFELPGYSEKEVAIVVSNKELNITAKKIKLEGIQSYLSKKLTRGVRIKKILPGFVNLKNFSHTMKNGVLEIVFNKK
ncbi:MAG: Hsp20 family protein [Nanoarchaeota archaeon]|nr:Hsp20 family protein [Nanoarchaeota archaeon]MBU1102987.1 Hsp20 family protein [Nanoarchaeota archaeon]